MNAAGVTVLPARAAIPVKELSAARCWKSRPRPGWGVERGMIQFGGAGKRFGAKLLFEDLDWLITPQDRVGIVGANGAGKTTLLRMLAGAESPDYGTISFQKGVTTGYLPQDGLTFTGHTVFQECMQVFADLRDMETEMESLFAQMAEMDHASAAYEQAADRYHQVEGEFQARDGYAVEAQVHTVLAGLGFTKDDLNRRTEEFSGGWQMRIALAKLLLAKPNLLLLDEPTNHLDLETRNWLEEYLDGYPHAVVLISHDRYFLDVTVRRIIEIWNKKVHFYPGNYERYLAQKNERQAQLEAAWRNQRDRIEQLEAFINRFRYQATKAKQVQSRIKELEKIERLEIPPQEKTIHFRFPQPRASGRIVAEATGLAKSYGPKAVFRGVRFVIERGDRVALVGVNGAGKSTLIKLLAGLEAPTGGEIRLGHNVDPDYFAQDQYKELDPRARVLDDFWTQAPGRNETEVRSLLGCFLFSADEVFKPIGVLSGGERNRYALARMLLQPSNFLLLDEPTNHLDLRAKDVLLNALQDYTGTVVFVSHDRYFIDKLATRVFEIAGGHVEVYPGNYEDYRWRKERGPAAAPAPEAAPAVIPPAPATPEGKARRQNPIKVRQMKERLEQVEDQVARLEAEVAGCEKSLASFVSAEETRRLTHLLEQRRSQLAALEKEWEELSATLEEA
jgi:ATP-binding cassette subfamily F protein 3